MGGKGTSYSTCEDSYVSAIKQLRSTGYKFPIVIDAPDCGQNYSQLASSASKFKAADSLGNTMLSLHAYWSYQTSTKISAAMTALNSAGMPWVWGEFPSNQFQASIGQNTDHVSLMKLANSNGIGYLAWSWLANGSGEEQKLDMSTSYTCKPDVLGQASNRDQLWRSCQCEVSELLIGVSPNLKGPRMRGPFSLRCPTRNSRSGFRQSPSMNEQFHRDCCVPPPLPRSNSELAYNG